MASTVAAPRVVLLSAEYPPHAGGVGDYTAHLARNLHAQGVAVVVLTGDGAGTADDVVVWRRVHGWGRGLRRTVATALREWRADLLHIQYQTGAYAMSPAVNLLPGRVDLPCVVTLHDLRMPYLVPKGGPLRRAVTRTMLDHAAAVIVTNAEDAARLRGDMPPAIDPNIFSHRRPVPHTLIPIGTNIDVNRSVDRTTTRVHLGLPAAAPVVGYFGLLNRSKGVHTIIAALAQVPAAVHLLIIGGAATTPQDRAYAAEIEQQIEQHGLRRRIIWTGHVAATEVSAALQCVDVLALPFDDGASYRRGSLLAALAHGLPTITTPPRVPLDPALHDAVLLVPPHDASALATAIERGLNDAALQQRLSAAGQQIAAHFDWQRIALRHREMYERLR